MAMAHGFGKICNTFFCAYISTCSVKRSVMLAQCNKEGGGCEHNVVRIGHVVSLLQEHMLYLCCVSIIYLLTGEAVSIMLSI